MIRSIVLLGAVLLAAGEARAVPVAPGQGMLAGDTVAMDQQFHLNGYNVRIQKIEWLSADAPFVKKTGENIDDGKGMLVFTLALKNTKKEAQEPLIPAIQAIYKDGTQSEEENRFARTAAGDDVQGSYQPGQGLIVRYAIANMAKPSSENPITKVIIKPYNGGDNDAGAAKVFRLNSPPVSAP